MTFIADKVLSDSSKDFYVNKFLPELEEGVKNVKVPILDKFKLLQRAIGLVIKLIYAFLYQEQYIPIKFFLTPAAIEWGGHHVKTMNDIADSLTEFP